MKRLLIVYHFLTGGTRQMAEAAAGAATELGVDVRLLRAVAAGPGDVLAADRRTSPRLQDQ
jgi:flavodoxin